MKSLVSAYKCFPGVDSEAEVGWQWVNRLSEFHEIVVITRRPNLLENVHQLIKQKKNLRFAYYDLPKIFDFMRTGDLRHFIYYNLWQIGAFFNARKLVKKEKFDLVHHLVYVNTWQPTYMAFLGLPFIFGPIGENPKIPIKMIKYYGVRVLIREIINRLIKKVGRNINPIMRLIYKKANKIIVINNDVEKNISKKFLHKTLVHPAIGVSLPNLEIDEADSFKNTFKIVYCGRFVHIKCPDLALISFLNFAHKYPDVELTMVGGGRMERDLMSILKNNDNAYKVKLMGWIERKKVLDFLRKCDVFLFPTFEGGGMVILEAMSYGKPLICLDFGGSKEFLTDECGIRIPVINRKQIINELSKALDKLYNDNNLRLKLGRAARKRVEDYYTWDKKVEWMNNIYREVVEARLVER